MRWHKEGVRHDPAVVSHPADGEAWKQFDLVHPDFACEYRNVDWGYVLMGLHHLPIILHLIHVGLFL